MILKGQLIMANALQLLEILNSKSELKTELLQPAIKAAVDAELIPKFAGEELYLKNWEGIEAVLKVFLANAEKKV